MRESSDDKAVFVTRVKVPLDRFDLDVDYRATSRVTGIFGVSGSGKTTYVESIAGLRRGAKGYIRCGSEVWLDTEHGVNVPAHRRRIGYVPQEHLLFPNMNVRENLSFAKARAEADGADFDKVFINVIEVLEIAKLLERSVTDLSGGERQRVSLGRALCSGPRLLLLDEPTASLDAKLRLKILPFLKRVRDVFFLPIVIVSHNPSELIALCDEIVAFREGRILASGKPLDVLTRSDIFSDVEGQGLRNILPCVFTSARNGTSTVRLGDGGSGPELIVPFVEVRSSETAFADIAASEIMLSRSKPLGISARNVVPCRVTSVKDAGRMCVVEISLGIAIPNLAVEITPDARDEMAMTVGEDVYMIVKSSSIMIHTSGI
jgi:molybdate transport system ATP-binding protein